MSKIICAHFRKKSPDGLRKKLTAICKKIEPDNIVANPPKLIEHGNSAIGILNPVDTIKIHDDNVLLGHIIEEKEKILWYNSKTDYPDGSFALFRNDVNHCEIVTDIIGSRTIWYYLDEDQFLAATSQRALILFLGNFEFDERCIPWMLSTGSLGPNFSWDKRIQRVPPATALILDKKKWKLKSSKRSKPFKPVKKSNKKHKSILETAIASTFENSNFNLNRWVLPLSGGYDSRGILFFMLKTEETRLKLKTITWGLKESLNQNGNDANIAKKIADTLALSHKYYHTDISSEPFKKVLERFILMGEGRIDHIGGYLDGFQIWKTLFEDGVQGIIRGDEGFGWNKVFSPVSVRYSTGLTLCSDYINLEDYCERFNLLQQEIPEHLEQLPTETLNTWRDRIYHEYRLPTILAALSDLKLGYVEQATPLLSKEILDVVRGLPDKLRTHKSLFRIIVDSLEPKIEYANKGANANLGQILRHNDVVELLKTQLSSKYAESVLPSAFLQHVVQNLRTADGIVKSKLTKKQLAINYIKRHTPLFIKKIKGSKPYLSIDHNILGFRIYIILFMHKLCSSEHENL